MKKLYNTILELRRTLIEPLNINRGVYTVHELPRRYVASRCLTSKHAVLRQGSTFSFTCKLFVSSIQIYCEKQTCSIHLLLHSKVNIPFNLTKAE